MDRKRGRKAKKATANRRVHRGPRRRNPRSGVQAARASEGNTIRESAREATEFRRDSAGRIPSLEGDEGSDRGQGSVALGDSGGIENGSDLGSSVPKDDPPTIIQRVTYKIDLPDPADHPKQSEFIYSDKKRKIIRAGRRGGKTTGSAILAVLTFLKGKHVLYAAPTIEQVAKFWHEVVIALAEPIEYGIYRKLEGDRIEKPGTEQCIRVRTAWNPDTLRGGFADLMILDEFQMMHEDTWSLVGSPMLADHNGDAVFIYTPPSMRMRAKTLAGDPLHAMKMFKAHKDDSRWLCLHFTSYDNPFISEEGLKEVASDLSTLGFRQEIMAEDIEEVPGGLWTMRLIESTRVQSVPETALPFVRVVVGVDPSGSSTNEAGIVAAAKGSDGHGYVLADKSLLAPTPRAWAQEAVWLYWEQKADRIAGERNYGGDMIKEVILTVDQNVSYKDVTATRGKQVRAEPIMAMYEKAFIHHVGIFDKMEEEMVSYVPGITKVSPNRMDALVWALTELFPESPRLTLAAFQNEQVEAMQRVQQSTLIRPAINPKTEACPECGAHCLNRRGPITICAQCGKEFGGEKKSPAAGGRAGLFK